MSHNQCRNGVSCTRADCWFSHPPGRVVGGNSSGGYAGGRGGQNECRFGRQCHREDCFYQHPQGRDIDNSAPPAGGISAGPGVYRQPSPGAGAFNPDEWEGDDQLEAEEAAALAAVRDCECCNGQPLNCSTAACKANGGRCGCTMGEVDDAAAEVDDSWRDEWFPQHRNCPCCAGSIYRCQKQQDDCVSGNCFCSLSKGQQPQQA